jgi:hypothetical protein
VIQTLANQAFTKLLFAKANARINYLNPQEPKKIPTKYSRNFVLLGD